ncbi:hypothetical protein MRY87_04195 [bacterium]|nr:hypothetical protein [bacterium]
MAYIIVMIVGLISAAGCAGAIFVLAGKNQGGMKKSVEKYAAHLEEQGALTEKLEELYSGLIDLGSLQKAITEYKTLQESLKAERGRITITQAELETVETRLRELEEIERELEASGIETKEELNILKKKEAELRQKNEELRNRIAETTANLDKLVEEVEMSSQVQEQILAMKTQLLETEQRAETLITEIEAGNEQYFILKKRYDALDIEYAQLYEKFSEADDDDDDDDE